MLAPSFSRAAAEDSPETLFDKGLRALHQGSVNEAVELFEALADRGYVDPNASFDRSLSYIGRVRSGGERPGDLGRAAAALEETLLLRPDDREAESALDLVRAEVARRRARGGAPSDVEARPTFERAVVGLLSERAWSVLAAISSLLLSTGLALRAIASRKPPKAEDADELPESREPRDETLHLASTIIVPLGFLCLLSFALLAFGAERLRVLTREGVVVVPEAHLVTEKGVLTSSGPIPEAARVEIDEQRGSLIHVRWGTVEGWTQADGVRRLARP